MDIGLIQKQKLVLILFLKTLLVLPMNLLGTTLEHFLEKISTLAESQFIKQSKVTNST